MNFKRFIYNIMRIIPDPIFLKIMYRIKLHKKLDLVNPKTFNEKLQWLKLNDRKSLYTNMVDKYEAKKIVGDIIGLNCIIPTLGIYDKFDDIDFSQLPNQFVIKCTHDSGGLVIVKDKNDVNINAIKKKINKSLRYNYYNSGREWPYKNVKPRIIIEKYMIDNHLGELRDYKLFCFNGHVKFYKIDFNRFNNHQANYYSKTGKPLKFGETMCPPDYNKKIEIPSNINKMIDYAEKLSKDIPFIRVDFYEINGEVYFGELTFYPASGFGKLDPAGWDEKIGTYIKI